MQTLIHAEEYFLFTAPTVDIPTLTNARMHTHTLVPERTDEQKLMLDQHLVQEVALAV